MNNNDTNINSIAAEALNMINPQHDTPSTVNKTLAQIEWLTDLVDFAPRKQELCALLWALITRHKDSPSGRFAVDIMPEDDAELMDQTATIIFACENIANDNMEATFDNLHGLDGECELIVTGEQKNGIQTFTIDLKGADLRSVKAIFNGDKWTVTS